MSGGCGFGVDAAAYFHTVLEVVGYWRGRTFSALTSPHDAFQRKQRQHASLVEWRSGFQQIHAAYYDYESS
jgi:hypothetical protein